MAPLIVLVLDVFLTGAVLGVGSIDLRFFPFRTALICEIENRGRGRGRVRGR
jgi:hypothetical protein